jgi:hypothetical protein
MKHTFTAVIKNGGIEVPFDVKETFGEARAPVLMTFCGETHKARVAVYDGKYLLGIWKAVLAKHDLRDGSSIDVTLEHDTAPRTITPPAELVAALAKNASAKAGWDAMSYTHQREWANAISDAKKPETRSKRVEQAIEAMLAKTKPKPTRKPAKTKPAKAGTKTKKKKK